jgi:type II pantothenate kinase
MDIILDFGLSNLKLLALGADGVIVASHTQPALGRVEAATVRAALVSAGFNLSEHKYIVVTGGQSTHLPDEIDGATVLKIPEIEAIGAGGLELARRTYSAPRPREALVVSCGSGTAMIAARGTDARHVSGTAVGGGTLLGLGQLLLHTSDPAEIDALAHSGDSSVLDLTLLEATGGKFGALPPDATAVNFGKAARLHGATTAARADIAASLVTMISQTIALIAIGAARAEHLDTIIVVGYLPGLASVSAQLYRTAGFYGANFVVPAQGGYATALGAQVCANRRNSR